MNENNINRLVAERVMGWDVSDDPRCKPPAMYREKCDGTIWYAGGCPLWNPTRDMNQAMEALLHAHKTEKIESWCMNTNVVRVYQPSRSTDKRKTRSEAFITPISRGVAMAICRSLLRAVGVPEEEVNRE